MRPILVVDDNDDARGVLAETLRMEGYDVLEAANGREALDIVERSDPSVVLLDLVMPGTSGEQVLAQLRRSGRLETMRVIVLTGLDRDIDVPGAYLVLPKPASLHQIVSQLEQIAPPP